MKRLDVEWLRLMMEAKEIGLTAQDVRDYINQSKENTRLLVKAND